MTSLSEKYRTISSGAGWIDRSGRGRLRFDGPDGAKFLQALLTNDVLSLQAGQGVYAAYLTPQGRMLADLKIHHCGNYFLADVADGQGAPLARRFDGLIFAEDLRVSDVSADIAQVTVIGRTAAHGLAEAFGLDAAGADQLSTLRPFCHLATGGAVIARTDEIDLPAFDVFVSADEREAVVRHLEALDAVQGSIDLFDALRIEAGHPAFHVDMDEDTIPLEAGLLERAISTSKGCYVGQEIIIRVLHRGGGRVAKRLVKLRFDPGVASPPAAGTPLLHDGREVGRVTSAAVSPSAEDGTVVALGYLQRERAEAGGHVSIPLEAGGHVATIVGLAG